MKTIKFFSIVAIFFALFLNVCGTHAQAQNLNKEATGFVKTFQDAYNRGDLAALMSMYAPEITYVHSDGKTEKVAKSEFEKDYVRDFGESAGTNQTFNISDTKTLADGKVKIKGSFDGYDFDRKTMNKLNPYTGDFDFVIAKEGGSWKFTEMKMEAAINQIWMDIRANVLAYQAAYNKEDAPAMIALYTQNSERIGADGKAIKGAANIEASFKETFNNEDGALIVKLANVTPNFDGSVSVKGTYMVNGIAKNGDRVARSGSYMNKAVKENGKWKFSEVKTGNLVKTIITHKVADFAKWKETFSGLLRLRRDAGELSFDVSTLNNDPNTVCVINEWASAENFQKFVASDDLKNAMKAGGVMDAPQMMILDKK